jgi:hypothetical protein
VPSREMLCLLKTCRDLQMLFAAVTHLAEVLTLERLLMLKVEKVSNLHSGHRETTVNFVLETLPRNKASSLCRLE